MSVASLAYRKNEAEILRGEVPAKYTRLLPYIPEGRVLELGSAEGVLSLLLALEGREVTALEMRQERHEAALALHREWQRRHVFPIEPVFVNGSINDRLDLLDNADVLVAVRMVYYLRDSIDDVFARIAWKAPNVVLCGNGNRAAAYLAGRPHQPLGEFNYYATSEGMKDLLTRHGYAIVNERRDGDPIVVGRWQRDMA